MNTFCHDNIKHLSLFLTPSENLLLSTAGKYFKNNTDRIEYIKKLKQRSCFKLKDIITRFNAPDDVKYDLIEGDHFDNYDKKIILLDYISDLSNLLLSKKNICIWEELMGPKKWYLSKICNSHSLYTLPLPPQTHKIHKVYRYKMHGVIRYTIKNSMLLKALIY
tara:strand:- start:929 stop:1420 length:492 start_codon:yes stop_codon:yes gene_type:complete